MKILRGLYDANILAAIVLSIGSYGGELQSSKYTYQMKRAIEVFQSNYNYSSDLTSPTIEFSTEKLATDAFCGSGVTEDNIKHFVEIMKKTTGAIEVVDRTDSAGYSMWTGKSLGIFTSVLLIIHVSKQHVCTARITQSGI